MSNVDDKTQYYVSEEGEVKKTKVTHQYQILPIITLSNEVNYNNGDGSVDNPYIVGEVVPSVLNLKRIRKSHHICIDTTFHHPPVYTQLLIIMYKDIITNLKEHKRM